MTTLETNRNSHVTALLRRTGYAAAATAALAASAAFAQTKPAEASAAPAAPAPAQEADPFPAPNYSGEIMDRSTLTGDWGGLRNDLAKKGLTLDIFVTQVFQGAVSGDRDKGWNYGGRENLTLNLDMGKMGLMPGGYLNLEGEGNFGEFVGLRQTGSVIPADNNQLFPGTDGPQFDLSQVMYTQFLSHNLGVFFGKMDATAGDNNVFAHGKGDHQFLNTAFCFNPIFSLAAPAYALGAGLIIIPTGNPNEMIITTSVMDMEGKASTTGFDTAFKGGTSFTAEARFTTTFFNLPGHQLVGGMYSDRLYTSVDQNLRNFIIPGLPVQTHSGAWAAYYNFDQYVYQPDPKQDTGLGLFGRFGISDGEANPIHYFGSIGLGGKGLIAGRKNDQFGIGYFRTCASSSPALDTLNFRGTQGIEAYYEIAITPSVFLTPDVQVVEPSEKGVGTACILGLRLTTKF